MKWDQLHPRPVSPPPSALHHRSLSSEVVATATASVNNYFIDGPGRLTSALQLLSQSASSLQAAANAASSAADREPRPVMRQHHLQPRFPSSSPSSSNQPRSYNASPERHLVVQATSTSKTIVASDNEVSNGFVKDGKMLPYVFEANESGTRKRSSKILPVCGVCGKRFVCVTTMKRHLVTHTGEKPFSCKICGKQYTQKGNLRVHERTHRNDRPFECNICHQKFYRKEPMQKHQWRQHGIVHFKQRPNEAGGACGSQLTEQPTHAASAPEGVLYNSLVDRIKSSSLENYGESSRHLDGPQLPPPPRCPSPPTPRRYLYSEGDASGTSPPSSSSSTAAAMAAAALNMSSTVPNEQPLHTTAPSPVAFDEEDDAGRAEEFKHAKLLASFPAVGQRTPDASDETSNQSNAAFSDSSNSPHELSLSSSTVISTNSNAPTARPAASSSRDASPSASAAAAAAAQMTNNYALDKRHDENDNETTSNAQPMKLKKMLAHAYQREVMEAEEREHCEQQLDSGSPGSTSGSSSGSSSTEKEAVECQCKTCGNVFIVLDPYNFRCSHCHVKYTSLPTHMIADPLQCIGCCQAFPHKPALKAHQTCADKERPFRCCKCGYGFRQKAHLQKHQWRIHRRKLDPEPNIGSNRAEDYGGSCKQLAVPSGSSETQLSKKHPLDFATITMQDIIDHGVEKSMREAAMAKASHNRGSEDSADNSQPLDLSPTKALLAASREENPKLKQFVASLTALQSREPRIVEATRETNPLLNARPLTLTVDNGPTSPVFKRQRRLSSASSTPPPAPILHASLPQQVSSPSSSSLLPTTVRHSTWITPSVTATREPARPAKSAETATNLVKEKLLSGGGYGRHSNVDARTV